MASHEGTYTHAAFVASLINPSLFFIALEIEKKSISLVRWFNIDVVVVAVETSHDTVACLCMNAEENTFSFAIMTVDGTTGAAFPISRIPADPEVSWRHMLFCEKRYAYPGHID
jgi:hypothetical protein